MSSSGPSNGENLTKPRTPTATSQGGGGHNATSGGGGGHQFGSRQTGPARVPLVGQGPVAAVATSWGKQITADPRAVLFGGIAIVMLAGSMVYEYK
jgi:hypothetical protein